MIIAETVREANIEWGHSCLTVLPQLKYSEVTNKHYVMTSGFALNQKELNEKGQPCLGSQGLFVSLNGQYLLISQLFFSPDI